MENQESIAGQATSDDEPVRKKILHVAAVLDLPISRNQRTPVLSVLLTRESSPGPGKNIQSAVFVPL
jgi:hypothetical protein